MGPDRSFSWRRHAIVEVVSLPSLRAESLAAATFELNKCHCSLRFYGLILFRTLTRGCADSSVPYEKGPQRHSNHAIAVHETGVEKDQAVKNSIRDGLMIHAEKYYFPLLHSRHHDRLMTRRLLAVAEPCTLSQRASPHPNESFKHFRHMFHSSEKGACFS